MLYEFLENVSISLVREFLKRKGLTITYQTLDEEFPKTEDSITNRTDLAKYLHIEKLLKQNKKQATPLRTILEVVVRSLIENEAPKEQYGDSRFTYQPPVPARNPQTEHSRATPLPSQHTNNGNLVIEDDLETEQMAGRGMDDVIPHQATPQTAPLPPQSRQTKRKKHRKAHAKPSMEEEEVDQTDLDMKGPAHLTAGYFQHVQKGETNPALVENDGEITSGVNLQVEDEVGIQQDDGITPNVDIECGDRITSADVTSDSSNTNSSSTPSHGQEEVAVAEPTPDSHSDDGEKLVPKPPQKMPEYMSSSVKSNVEKSMELLRQRRLMQQRAESILQPQKVEVAESVERSVPQGEIKEMSSAAIELEPEEESYSPRIIYPVEDVPPVSADNERTEQLVSPSKGAKATIKSEEETVNKQPAKFMSVKEVISTAKPIDIQTAMELKKLVLGMSSQLFYEDWKCQGLTFCDLPGLLYGLIQHKPGPCGVVTVVQAYLMQELLFTSELTRDMPLSRKLSPHTSLRSKLLAGAISKLLWKCGEEKRAVLALPSETSNISGGGRYKPDGITETLILNTIDNFEDVQKYTLKFLPYFEDDDSSGAILLLYSAVLSRGIELVIDDMDDNSTPLITNAGLCAPELVNLLLCGKAASNAFNDSMELTQGLGKTIILKGIPSRCDIGLLSLQEHTNRRYKIGTFLKTPKYPLWLCLIDDHYSLVFCVNKDLINDWKAERHFQLCYYDPLSKHDQPIRLTLDTTSRFFEPPDDDDSVPPLELSLRTKWRDAQIDWNGTEPILAPPKRSLMDDLL